MLTEEGCNACGGRDGEPFHCIMIDNGLLVNKLRIYYMRKGVHVV